jgi:hypothetical protein
MLVRGMILSLCSDPFSQSRRRHLAVRLMYDYFDTPREPLDPPKYRKFADQITMSWRLAVLTFGIHICSDVDI